MYRVDESVIIQPKVATEFSKNNSYRNKMNSKAQNIVIFPKSLFVDDLRSDLQVMYFFYPPYWQVERIKFALEVLFLSTIQIKDHGPATRKTRFQSWTIKIKLVLGRAFSFRDILE